MKLKIETEIEIKDPNGWEWEFVRYGLPVEGDWYTDMDGSFINKSFIDFKEVNKIIIRLIEPALELETDYFIANGGTNKISMNRIEIQKAGIITLYTYNFSLSQARDLAKILNYWAENNRLPTRVKVKA